MSDPSRFDLDDRQRAMLAETEAAPVAAAPVASVAPAPVAAAPVETQPAPKPAPVTPPPARAATPALNVKPLADGVDRMDWAALQETAAACQACGLCEQRKNSVFGVGDVQADWLVVGEAPSEEDDLAGEPFAGQAGQLLDNMLKAVGLSRKAQGAGGVYIANVTKCRTPGTQNPSPEELATCAPYLARQVALVQPKIILLMGRFAVQSVLQSTEPLGKLRGQVHTHQGVPVVVTYHPSYLLRNPADKAKAWADLVLALKTVQG
jgi:DNA polymerase